MKFDIFNRYTREVQFTAEIYCNDDAPEAIKCGLAVKWALKNGADLRGADLRWSCLRWSDLRWSDLRDADLRNADLRDADLRDADLRNADLREADLRGAKNVPALTSAQTSITPKGQFIGWKKCHGCVIVKLSIPAEARRSNATGRKCRADFVDVLEVIGDSVGVSTYDGKTVYRAGKRVTCHEWCEDRWAECAGGIHFFLTRAEAEDYCK